MQVLVHDRDQLIDVGPRQAATRRLDLGCARHRTARRGTGAARADRRSDGCPRRPPGIGRLGVIGVSLWCLRAAHVDGSAPRRRSGRAGGHRHRDREPADAAVRRRHADVLGERIPLVARRGGPAPGGPGVRGRHEAPPDRAGPGGPPSLLHGCGPDAVDRVAGDDRHRLRRRRASLGAGAGPRHAVGHAHPGVTRRRRRRHRGGADRRRRAGGRGHRPAVQPRLRRGGHRRCAHGIAVDSRTRRRHGGRTQESQA